MRKKRTITPETLALMEKVKLQLAELQKPRPVPVMVKRFKTAIRDKRRQVFPTVEDYQKLDPCWMSTMRGAFAGRTIENRKWTR
jgi:hypothetical protein